MMFVTNHGQLGRDIAGLFGYDYGTWYPFTDTSSIRSDINGAGQRSPLYSAGLWLGGKVNGQIRVAVSYYQDEFVPGPMLNGTFQTDRPEFRVYHLYSDSLAITPNMDYLNWPVDQGAPVAEGGTPLSLGNQTLWCVYNDADAAMHANPDASTSPLGIEVQQTVWADSRPGHPQDNIILIQYKLYNKGHNSIDSFFVSLWSDPDLGSASDDLVGCDTIHQLLYCYNATNSDGHYGSRPPAIGFQFVYGPVVPSPEDTAYFDGNELGGYRNLPAYSFANMNKGTDPDNPTQIFNYMKGLTATGDALANGTRFAVPGDPVTGVGDLDSAPSDRRMMGTFGPIQFNPGDSQAVLIRMVAAQGTDRLSSISLLKSYANTPPPSPLDTPSLQTTIEPQTIYRFQHDGYDPTPDVCISVGYNPDGSYGKSFDASCVCVNAMCAYDSIRFVTSAPVFRGKVMKLYMPAGHFLSHYLNHSDSISYSYRVMGLFSGNVPYSVRGRATIVGHRAGDYNVDGSVDILDVVLMANYLFAGSAPPVDLQAADISGDEVLDISDVVTLIDRVN